MPQKTYAPANILIIPAVKYTKYLLNMEGGGGGFGTLELFAVANLRIRNKELFISFSYKERFSLFATVFFKKCYLLVPSFRCCWLLE
jgi:hypothetical protein